MADGSTDRFAHPPEWSDRERMHYLLAPIPPNKALTVNDSKITFWSNLIKSSSRELRRPVFTERELLTRLKWNQVSPSCLSFVIESMERAGEITRVSEIRQSVDQGSSAVGWLSWGVGVIRKPVSWAMKNYLPSSTGTNVDEEYVVVSAVKELAEKVIAEQLKTVQYKSTDNVMKHSSFVELCRRAIGSESPANVSVVELWLLKEKKIAKAMAKGNRDVIKFCEKREAITNTDREILSIKESISTLSYQVCQLQEVSAKLKQNAVEQFKVKNKKTALTLLRRHKVTESSLDKRQGALDNLQSILLQIQMAETDAMVYDAYKRGTEVLTNMRKALGIVADDVDEIAMNLQEALEANQEISDALSQVSHEMDVEDSDNLEAELEALLETDQGDELVPAAVQPKPPSKQTESVTDDDLEARLASLTISSAKEGTGLPQEVGSHKDQDNVHVDSELSLKPSKPARDRPLPLPA